MFISEAAALSIVREMKEITGHDINIMDGTGTIFAGAPAASARASTSPSSWTARR